MKVVMCVQLFNPNDYIQFYEFSQIHNLDYEFNDLFNHFFLYLMRKKNK